MSKQEASRWKTLRTDCRTWGGSDRLLLVEAMQKEIEVVGALECPCLQRIHEVETRHYGRDR
jgi:hypothetical protein